MRDLEGRRCLVTGGTTGIGKETARGLAQRGATVWITGRSLEKAAHVARALADDTGAPVEGLAADFSSLDAVRELARTLLHKGEPLHVLVNNAGLWHQRREASADGFEDTLAVNHLAPFLLTARLRDRLIESRPARVVTVSSRLHERERRFDFDDPFFERKRWTGLRAYRQSKLANVMFANELSRRLEGTGVTSNSLHPGDVATDVVRESRFLRWGLETIGRHFLMSAAEGARTSLHVATAPELEEVSGRYFKKERVAEPSRAALDREACRRLWAATEEWVGEA